jgi:hypothetical protein
MEEAGGLLKVLIDFILVIRSYAHTSYCRLASVSRNTVLEEEVR